jgi:hypothetical protein
MNACLIRVYVIGWHGAGDAEVAAASDRDHCQSRTTTATGETHAQISRRCFVGAQI